MSHFFITGIGTEIGKTFVTASLLHQAPSYRAIKPVLSGFEDEHAAETDAGILQQAMHEERTMDEISPWRYKAPLSPHLAAAKEGKAIEPNELIRFCEEQIEHHPDLLIEGVGGLMVPVMPNWLVLDWIKALKIPVILVSSSYLGAINHTLMTCRILQDEGVLIQGITVSESEPEMDAGLQDTADSLRPFVGSTPLITVPRIQSKMPWKDTPDLLSLIA